MRRQAKVEALDRTMLEMVAHVLGESSAAARALADAVNGDTIVVEKLLKEDDR